MHACACGCMPSGVCVELHTKLVSIVAFFLLQVKISITAGVLVSLSTLMQIIIMVLLHFQKLIKKLIIIMGKNFFSCLYNICDQ